MSEVKSDKLSPRTDSGTTTLGDSGDTFLVNTGAKLDINGTELILDADADTSITADTDDQIDIKIAGADNFQFTANTFTAQSGSTDANPGPLINLYRNSASPADYDEMGEIQFNGENSASEIVEYGAITGVSADVTDGQEDGRINMDVMTNGSTVAGLRIEPVDGTASIVQTMHSASSTAAVPNITFIGDNNTGMYRVGADAVGLTTGGTKRMEINSTDVEISTGNLLFGTAAKGVYLGVTSATAANLLADYEEGNWTPGVSFGGASVGVAYNSQLGVYVKVGKMVWCGFYLRTTSNGSSTGAANITGLPFTVSNTSVAAYGSSLVTNYRSGFSSDHYPGGYAMKNGTTIVLVNLDPDAAASSGLTDSDWTDTGLLYGHITYRSES